MSAALAPVQTLEGQRLCLYCDHPFTPKRKDQKYCCRLHGVRDAVSLHWFRTRRDYHAGRKLSVRKLLTCEECGHDFASAHVPRPRFCEKCRVPRDKRK